jgi:hypothetical protein
MNVTELARQLKIHPEKLLETLLEFGYDIGKRAVKVENGADAFAKSGRFDLEAIVHDPCSKDIQYHAHFIFPNAQLEGNSTTNLTTEGDHPFSFVAIQDYCATGQQLFSIIIPDVDDD